MNQLLVQPSDVARLLGRFPRWFGPFVSWSAGFALLGCAWIPVQVRKLPLRLASWMAKRYAKGVL